MIARLQRQVEEQQQVIAQLTAGNNRPAKRVNVEAQLERKLPVEQREPLLITWKKARLADFDGSMDPLVAQGGFKTT